MENLRAHKCILEEAVDNGLPDRISENGDVSVDVVRELIEEGYLRAIDASTFDGMEYLEPRITIAGREYLHELTERQLEKSPLTKVRRIGVRILDWFGGIVAGLVIAWISTRF